MLQVAQVLKSNGADGQLLIGILGISPSDIDLEEPVFIYIDGLPVPFYFESFIPKGTTRALVRLTGVRSLQDAEELCGQKIWADYFEEEDQEDFTGWTVQDENGIAVGTVSGYEDIPGNLCLWVQRPDGDEVLLPFHEDLVLGIGDGVLTLRIPDGLIS